MKKMKMKLSALSVFLLGASPAFADQATVTQSGTAGTASIFQTAGSDNDNSATIMQDVNASVETASITQVGNTQSATIYQNGQNDQATAIQLGSGGHAVIKQYRVGGWCPPKPYYGGSTAFIFDNGQNDSSSISNYGSNSTATINQVDNGNGKTHNEQATIDQDSDKSTAIIHQGGYYYNGTPTYVGLARNDEAYIKQGSDAIGNMYAFIEQFNTKNENAKIIQSCKSNNDTAIIIQSGSKDKANIRQDGYYNVSQIYQQNTDNNNADITQDNTVSASYAMISQMYGNLNIATISQKNSSSNDIALISQTGNSNDATIQEYNSYGDRATITEIGDSNTARIDQGVNCGYSSDNIATITQSGSFDVASISQDGSSNVARIDQVGVGKIGSIAQCGSGNNSIITQH